MYDDAPMGDTPDQNANQGIQNSGVPLTDPRLSEKESEINLLLKNLEVLPQIVEATKFIPQINQILNELPSMLEKCVQPCMTQPINALLKNLNDGSTKMTDAIGKLSDGLEDSMADLGITSKEISARQLKTETTALLGVFRQIADSIKSETDVLQHMADIHQQIADASQHIADILMRIANISQHIEIASKSMTDSGKEQSNKRITSLEKVAKNMTQRIADSIKNVVPASGSNPNPKGNNLAAQDYLPYVKKICTSKDEIAKLEPLSSKVYSKSVDEHVNAILQVAIAMKSASQVAREDSNTLSGVISSLTKEVAEKIAKDEANTMFDRKEKLKVVIKDEISPAITTLSDYENSTIQFRFFNYYHEVIDALESYECREFFDKFDKEDYTPCSEYVEFMLNEVIRRTVDLKMYVHLRQLYRRRHNQDPTAGRMMKMIKDRYIGPKYGSNAYYELFSHIKLQSVYDSSDDYFRRIDFVIEASKWYDVELKDMKILINLIPGVKCLCYGEESELYKVSTLKQFREWVVTRMELKRGRAEEKQEFPAEAKKYICQLSGNGKSAKANRQSNSTFSRSNNQPNQKKGKSKRYAKTEKSRQQTRI